MKRFALLAALALGSTACGPAAQGGADAGLQTVSSEAKDYLITLQTAHAHIYRKVAQLFTVYDLDTCTNRNELATCTKVKGLPVVAFARLPGATEVIEQPLEPGKLEDNGDGTYAYYIQFGDLGTHMIGLKVADQHTTHFAAFPFETSRAGGEKFLCDTNGDTSPDVVQMVRWNASMGHILADGSPIKFTIELMRSVNTPVNLTEPWNNTFDHLTPSLLKALPTVMLMAGKGAAAKEIAHLTPTYKGKGLYEVTHSFTADQLGGEMERVFWLDIEYTDSTNCHTRSAEFEPDYYFSVLMQH